MIIVENISALKGRPLKPRVFDEELQALRYIQETSSKIQKVFRYEDGKLTLLEAKLVGYGIKFVPVEPVQDEREVYGLEDYSKDIQRTMNKDLSYEQRLTMLSMGLAGEAGELVDAMKKHVFHGHNLDIEDLRKEMGDVLWYLINMMNELAISPDDVLTGNINKLSKRYPEGFSEEASKNRVDTKELPTLPEEEELE